MAISYKNQRIRPEDRFRIKELIDKKMKASHIAREMGINSTTFHAELKRAGVTAMSLEDYDPIRAQKVWDEHTDFSKRKFRKFSEEEQIKIKKMIDEGKSVSWISRELWCGYKTIQSYLQGKNVRVPFRGLKTNDLKKRVETLEQHIEIIFDMFKQLEVKK